MNNNFHNLISFDVSEHYDLTLSTFNDFNKQVEIIVHNYFSSDNINEEYIENITTNNDFRVALLKNIQQRMRKIISDSSTLLYKELITVVHLLSLGQKYTIFEEYNTYSKEEVSTLFREYEKKLLASHENDKEDFELTFNYYITLLDAYNELCIINSTDIQRKKTIKIFVELMTESINTLKFSMQLDESKITLLSIFQAKLLINFSTNLHKFSKTNNKQELIYEYEFIFNKLIDGYTLADSFTAKNSLYGSFILNSVNVLLLLLKKLEEREDVVLSDFSSILKSLKKYCIYAETKIENIAELKELLFHNLTQIYDNSREINHDILIDTVLNDNKFSVMSIEIIHNIIFFSHDAQFKQLERLLIYLLDIPKFNNDYHEYYKLRTIDVIIEKLIEYKKNEFIEEYIPQIVTYIRQSNIASHLMSSFSKIYLSIAFYYSLQSEDDLKKSQRAYFIGEKICSFTLLRNEYETLYKKILINNAKSYFDSLALKHSYTNEELEKFGQKLMNDFFINENINIRYEVNNEIEKIIEFILTNNNYGKEKFEKSIEDMLSQKIFFGLATCKISQNIEYDESFSEPGYEVIQYELLNDYHILYKFSYAYSESFNVIYNGNKSYIRNNINNLLLSYQTKQDAVGNINDILTSDYIDYDSLLKQQIID